MFFNIGA